MYRYACLLDPDTRVFDPDNLQPFDSTYDPDTDVIYKRDGDVAYLIPKWAYLRALENDYDMESEYE